VQLTPRERRALRAIEEALAAEDPALAGFLNHWPTPWRARLLRWGTWAAVVVAAILLLVGLVLSDSWLFLGAVLALVALVVILRRAGGGTRA
jgi:Mn2+/Fe2+ NRAMP family transporter